VLTTSVAELRCFCNTYS